MILADVSEAELGGGGEVFGGEVVGEEAGPGGGGDHGGVVGGEGEGWEGDGEAAAVGFGGEAAAELGVGGYSSGDDDAVGSEGFGGGEGLRRRLPTTAYWKLAIRSRVWGSRRVRASEGFRVGLAARVRRRASMESCMLWVWV